MITLEAVEEVIDELDYAISETAGEGGVIENLEAIAIDLQSILASGKSLDGPGFRMYNTAMRSNIKRLGMNHGEKLPSMEMFEDPLTARGASVIALEGVFDAIGDAFKAIWEWIMGIFKAIGEFFGMSSKKVEEQDKKIDKTESEIELLIGQIEDIASGKTAYEDALAKAKEKAAEYKFFKIDRDGTTHVALSHRNLSILAGGKEDSIKNISNVKTNLTSLGGLVDELSGEYLVFMGGLTDAMNELSQRLDDDKVESLRKNGPIDESVKRVNIMFERIDTRIKAMATRVDGNNRFFMGGLNLTADFNETELNHHRFESRIYETKHLNDTDKTIAVQLKDFHQHAKDLKELGRKLDKLEPAKDAINKSIEQTRKAMEKYSESIKEHIQKHGIQDIRRSDKQHEYQHGHKYGADERQSNSYESVMGSAIRNIGNYVRGLGLVTKSVIASREAVIEVYSSALKFQKKVRQTLSE